MRHGRVLPLHRPTVLPQLAEGAGISLTETNYALDAAEVSVSLNARRYEHDELGDFVPNANSRDPEDLIEELGDTEAVYAALAELDDDERRVIEARYGFGEWDGNDVMSVEDISRVVMLTQRHVQRCLASATEKLRSSLSVADLS